MNLDFNKKISIGIIWLFHLSGLVGLLYIDKNLFASLTPLNLFISSTLLFVNQKSLKKKEIIIVFLIFSIGMIAEILGVNYGLIFGKYDYGDNLGLKLLGVPLLIGLNWVGSAYQFRAFLLIASRPPGRLERSAGAPRPSKLFS